ncbi:MAG: PSD1 and planctomycete cytochrome C domain-containing protein [Gemmataceae bacterium]|nr:PSD1 and planctomycete cytochrome C domain-containing protein [Gemmataceae bacterium]
MRIPRRPARLRLPLGGLTLALLVFSRAGADGPTRQGIDFNMQVRPILSENCFACHGPDDKIRKAQLRLDTREGAFGKLRSGLVPIVPGKPDESELIARVSSHQASEMMPPPKSGKKLTAQQIDLLKKWVAQGAEWSVHWAFVPPKKPALPLSPRGERGRGEGVSRPDWPHNPVDHFILARLEQAGLEPSPEADRPTLIRRVTLDLTGLPPTPEEVEAFVKDPRPDAYERLVDRLLNTPRHGEHMARFWLDSARYGDTHGLHLDNYREIWPYREWVIRAFNHNMPYNRFLTEQLAGDLLPSPTLDQQIATGFLRCHVTTSEGGSIEEEVYVRNVVDRVDTNSVVLMGLTVGCARCHDHRYDPISTKDYYRLFAFFNSLDGRPLDGNAARHPPVVSVATPAQTEALARLDQKAAPIRKQIAETLAKLKYDDSADAGQPEDLKRAEYVWVEGGLPAGAKQVAGGGVNVPWTFAPPEERPTAKKSKTVRLKAKGLQQVVFVEAKPGLRVGTGDTLYAHVYLDPKDPPKEIMVQWNSGDWKHRIYLGENLIQFGRDNSPERLKLGPLPPAGQWVKLEIPAARVGLKPGMVINGLAFTQHGGTAWWAHSGSLTRAPQGNLSFDTLTAWLQLQRATGGAGLPKEIEALVKLGQAKRSPAQQQQLRDYFAANVWSKGSAVVAPLNRELAAIQKERGQIEKQIPASLVFKEAAKPRPAFVLKRGEYDQRGEQVSRDTPGFLPPLPADLPRNRLGFAKWLTDPGHPLTARVAVNRLWQQCFGTGLVRTSEDFGSQGEPPTHPQLLDWLAVQFVSDGWDVRQTLRRLVTSATYRQSARVTKDRLAKDAANRLLSRGPRFRLDAETLRDQALAVSGLLVEKVGGPSVRPPQPPGLWEAVAFTGSDTGKFTADKGRDKVHRRSLYTFWKRTAHTPQMATLDAPSRESCSVRRERTNTPLQALLMMNEQLFVEAARALAERTLREEPGDTQARLRHLFRLVTARAPDEVEMSILRDSLQEHLERFRAEPKAAQELIRVGESQPTSAMNAEELAAWTMVGNLVLNLDEVINR